MAGENQGGERKGVFEDVEGTARRMGWKPEAEFKGPKDKWRPADEYVDTAMTNYPVLIDRYRTLDSRAAKTEKQLLDATSKLDEIGSAVMEMRDFHAQSVVGAEKRAYAQAVADLKQEIQQATKDADPAAADAALKKLDTLIENKPAEGPAPKKKPAAEGGDDATGDGTTKKPPAVVIQPEITAWVARNPWYNADRKMNALAVATSAELKETEPELTLAENLERVTEEVKRLFPEKFPDDTARRKGEGDDDGENPRRRGAPSVNEPGDDTPPARRSQRGRTYGDLPAEAKAACDRFTKTMVKGKDGKQVPMMTREAYLASYPWEA